MVVQAASLLSRRGVAARLAQLETVLGLPLGWVSHVQFDPSKSDEKGVEATRIAAGIPFANGLAITPDERTMIVAATTYPGLFIYDLPTSSPPHTWPTQRPKTKLHLPFRVDNLAWSHHPSSSPQFNNLTLLATGHPSPFRLISMSQNPSSHTSPAWSLAIKPSAPPLPLTSQKWPDSDAPLPAHHFTLSHNAHYSIRTLLQSTGHEAIIGTKAERVRIPSSITSFYHPYTIQGSDKGTLLVSALYGPLLACTNVST